MGRSTNSTSNFVAGSNLLEETHSFLPNAAKTHGGNRLEIRSAGVGVAPLGTSPDGYAPLLRTLTECIF